MPGKMTKSILRPPFRPPRYRQPSAARVYLAGRSEKRKIFTSAPESLGNPRVPLPPICPPLFGRMAM